VNFHTLRSLIKKGQISPVYYFFGKEKYLAEILSEEIIKNKISNEERDYSVFKFELEETGWEEIVNILSTSSFFSKSKVVIVKTNFSSRKKRGETYKDIVFLKNYLISPSQSSYLVVIDEERKEELFKIFSSSPHCTIFFLYPLKPDEIQSLIEERIIERGKKISPSAMAILLEEAQEDLSLSLNDLEKILTYIGDKDRIDKEDIENLVTYSGRFRIDSLIKAMDERDKFLAFRILKDILENFEPVFIVGTIASVYCRRYNNLLGEEYQRRERRNINEGEKEKLLYAFDKRMKRNEFILKVIFDTDIKIKSNPFNKGIVEEMIAKIIEGEGSLGNEGV
jgi:DNA polymerase-3 subunit delta